MSVIRILVVEDEESLRITFAANLELEGFDVQHAPNASMALELLAEQEFDVMISDIRMPGMSGIELAEEMRARGHEIPVVLMTAFTKEDLLHQAVASGVFTVLPKPFDIDHAVQVLSRAASNPHVLVVDDVEEEARSLVAVLHGANIKASYVTSVADALESIASGTVDVCLTDIVMPEADGVELVERLRTQTSITFVVFSGKQVPELMRRATSLGVLCCLKKPLAPLNVVRTVAQVRGRRRTV